MKIRFIFATIAIAILCMGKTNSQVVLSTQKLLLSDKNKNILKQHISEYTIFTIDKRELIDSLYKNGTTRYKAETSIILSQDFQVKAGAYFTAIIGNVDCADRMKSHKSLLSDIDDIDDINKEENAQKILSDNKPDIVIYPNLNNGTFTINTNIDPQEVISIQVFSMVGQSIYKQENMPSSTIQLPPATNGVFYVKITTATQKVIHKMVVM